MSHVNRILLSFEWFSTDVVRGRISRHRRRRSVSGHLLLAWSQRGQHRVLPPAFPAHRPALRFAVLARREPTLGTRCPACGQRDRHRASRRTRGSRSACPAGGRVTGAGGRRIVRHHRDGGGVPRDACG